MTDLGLGGIEAMAEPDMSARLNKLESEVEKMRSALKSACILLSENHNEIKELRDLEKNAP